MRELSNEARAMLDAARDGHDPNDHDRRRLTGAMVARLGAAAVISSSTTLAGSAAASSFALGALKTLAAVVVTGSVSATLLWQTSRLAARQQPTPSVEVTRNRAPEPYRAPSTPSVDGPVATAQPAPPAAQAERRRRAPTSSALGLAAQVRTLAHARAALRRGQAAEALGVLEENAAVFRQGALREEFLAARVRCLRELGRDTEASDAARDFESEMPSSPLVPKVTAPTREQP